MSKEFKEAYNKILNILYPGYSNLSDKRKDAIEFRTMNITEHALEIDELLDKMKDPNNPLYQEGSSDKDLVNIAAIYVRISKKSNEPITFLSDGYRLTGDSLYGPSLENTYNERSKTELEVLAQIKREVEEYRSKPKISVKRLIEGECIKKYDIDYNTAVEVNNVLKKMNSKEKVQEIKDVGMEIEN